MLRFEFVLIGRKLLLPTPTSFLKPEILQRPNRFIIIKEEEEEEEEEEGDEVHDPNSMKLFFKSTSFIEFNVVESAAAAVMLIKTNESSETV